MRSGMEAHGSPIGKPPSRSTGLLPDPLAARLMQTRRRRPPRARSTLAIDIVRRGGTISLSGVYGGMADPLPMMTLFDKQIQLRMGQANVRRWIDDILPLLHRRGSARRRRASPPIASRSPRRPDAYEIFQKKQDGAVKVLLRP